MTTGPTDGTVTTAAGGPDGMPLALRFSEGLGLPPRFLHAGDGTPAHPVSRVAAWPAHNRDRMTHLLYSGEQLAAAISDERERWRTAAEAMASEADHRFTLDGTTAHWLRALIARACGPNV